MAGLAIVLTILASAIIAGDESIERLLHPLDAGGLAGLDLRLPAERPLGDRAPKWRFRFRIWHTEAELNMRNGPKFAGISEALP
jgi:hypothetical protein